jgi:hypothetical protein
MKLSVRRSGLLALVVASIALAGAAPSALAAGNEKFCDGNHLVGGASCWALNYHSDYNRISGIALTTSALTGVWISDCCGTRVSADAYSPGGGQAAAENWPGPSYPDGYGTVHDHSSWADDFTGYVQWN